MSKKTPPLDEEIELFRQMMKDVTPLKKGRSKAHSPKKPKRSQSPQESPTERHSLRPLSDGIEMSIEADTLISYFSASFPKAMRKKLSNGDIPYTRRLDLHEMRREEAHHALDTFIANASQNNHRCLLIIHGKGKGILKNLVSRWLKQYHKVLAYHSAIPKHGGTGSLYVYLKKSR